MEKVNVKHIIYTEGGVRVSTLQPENNGSDEGSIVGSFIIETLETKGHIALFNSELHTLRKILNQIFDK